MNRLSNGLKAAGLKPKALTDAEEYRRAQEGYVTEEEDGTVMIPDPLEPKTDSILENVDEMVVEEPAVEVLGEDGEKIVAEKEKISTSGPSTFSGSQ